jgi:hypothetical protein
MIGDQAIGPRPRGERDGRVGEVAREARVPAEWAREGEISTITSVLV